jgi:hypothetical protein
MDIGFLANRSLPWNPRYFDLQPALHSLTTYSTPKNTTSVISCVVQPAYVQIRRRR